jgi:uncharacterized protein
MNILFELSHPKHFYQFKGLMQLYIKGGHEILIVARKKDVLLDILLKENQSFSKLGIHAGGILGKLLATPKLLLSYFELLQSFKPDLIISKASPYAAYANIFYGGKTVIMPDSEVVSLTNWFVAPLAHLIITPGNFERDFGRKHKRVDGFFEESYLSPNTFLPDKKILLRHKIDFDKPFFILRFISWNANHDIGQYGFTDDQKIELVKLLKQYGVVYISAESSNVPDKLIMHLLKIPSNEIHHVLHYASLYIGDSQTMATESALLGTPSLRYNSFVGPNDMSNFVVLEEKLGMLNNYSDYSTMMNDLEKMLKDPRLKTRMLKKRDKYFQRKKDINQQIFSILDATINK